MLYNSLANQYFYRPWLGAEFGLVQWRIQPSSTAGPTLTFTVTDQKPLSPWAGRCTVLTESQARKHSLNLHTAAEVQEATKGWKAPFAWTYRTSPMFSTLQQTKGKAGLGFAHTWANTTWLHFISRITNKELWALLGFGAVWQKHSAVAIRRRLFSVLFCHSSSQLYRTALGIRDNYVTYGNCRCFVVGWVFFKSPLTSSWIMYQLSLQWSIPWSSLRQSRL